MTTIPILVAAHVAATENEDEKQEKQSGETHSPISTERLRLCHNSAVYWSEELPRYACRQQNKADAWAIAAGVLAAITGLAIFPTADSGETLAEIAVAVTGFLAAVFALVPRVKNYAEMAGKAREIATSYGPLRGDLMDALADAEAGKGSDTSRRSVIEAFQTAKAKKDELRYLPVRPQ
jgi:hypothetical protein